MKLLKLIIHEAETCGGLLNGVEIQFRDGEVNSNSFTPLCLIGPNGSGKSQVLQIIAEIFQLAFTKFIEKEKKTKTNESLHFELQYLIPGDEEDRKFKLYTSKQRNAFRINLAEYIKDGWKVIESSDVEPDTMLPSLVVGYTSGENETLSRPFYASRSRFARDVAHHALRGNPSELIAKSKLMLVDYGTSLEVLLANLLQNKSKAKSYLLEALNLKALHSFRCMIQLNLPDAPKGGIRLTDELRDDIENLKRCSTCFSYEENKRVYIFDFWVNSATNAAFDSFWRENALSLYNSFHNLAMLNDLMTGSLGIFDIDPYKQGFSKRLVEPVDEQKVFRFENIKFISKKHKSPVDYVSLSDGEHQLAQLIAMFSMVESSNVLFLLDEPESHFNPQWRTKFITQLIETPTNKGVRAIKTEVAKQDCLISTHSPFVPSDMSRENVLIFSKNKKNNVDVRRPNIQTYGSRFESILAECFGISPPVSALSGEAITKLIADGTVEEIESAIELIGESSLKMRLAGRLAQLQGE